jgi:hypothetical protein
MLTRRTAFLLPILLASCGDDEPAAPVRRDFPPLRYSYLPPINLNVQRLETDPDFEAPSGSGEVSFQSPVSVVDTLYAMARDRLKPVASGGVGTFRVLAASIARRRDGLSGMLVVRLDVHDAGDANTGFAEARVTASKAGAGGNSQAGIYDILKSMMDDMNVELEFQLRNKLRAWIVEAQPPAAPAPSAATPAATPGATSAASPAAAEPAKPSEPLPLPPPPPPPPR